MKVFLSIKTFILIILLTGPVSFAAQLEDIRAAISAKRHNWVAAETSVSRLSDQEKKLRLGLVRPARVTGQEQAFTSQEPPTEVPANFDWRSNNGGNFVSPVRDQGNCGSCWAFATTAALESYILIKDNKPGTNENRAEEILLSCSPAGSCNGGYISTASDYIRTVGLPHESYFPYTASSSDDSCGNAQAGWQTDIYKISSWSWITTSPASVSAIKNGLANGPLVTTMDVYDDFFSYSSGVYEHATGGLAGGHAVLIVGYKDDVSVNGGGYFIVKNSWGTYWGQSGFFNIAYSQIGSPVYFGEYTIAYHGATPPPGDTTPPNVTNFTIPSTATSLTVPITTFTATDNVGVTGYMVTESATPPAPAPAGWSATPQTSYTFATVGTKTLYAWAKDAAGNVSAGVSDTVTVSPPDITQIVLSPGWNFLSLPKLPPNTAVASVLSTVLPNLKAVLSYDGQQKTWTLYKPSGGSGNTLTSMEPGKGYWVYTVTEGSISMAGWGSLSSKAIYLYAGWNLIGYNGNQNGDVVQSLSQINGKWDVLWNWESGGWDAVASDPDVQLPLAPMSTLDQGKAYWIKVKAGMAGNWLQ